ncbi:energy-coupling factor transporter transmembrane component T [Paenibacillus pinihumi]|uniref:energy-coupling factor transporter transmembrane component T n=1 Tax=Paenibacillus pinihumi TaxID=669462 RepID=UPI00040A9622|nr:energy-coupling factor transporter transmembrane component T [Paenibacillus pinihumi]
MEKKNKWPGGFYSLHPAISFVYFVFVFGAAVMLKHPLYLLTVLAVAIAIAILQDGGRGLVKPLPYYLLLALIIFISNPLLTSRGRTILFYFRDLPVTLEAIAYGALFAMSLLAVLIGFIGYNSIVTPNRFLYLFARFAPRTVFVITVAMRFVPLLKRRIQEIIRVQKSQGYFLYKKKKWLQAKEAMETMHTLVSWSLEEALQTGMSMRSRGYGLGKRSSAIVYRMERRDWQVLGWMAATGLLTLVGAMLGCGRYSVYPKLLPPDASYFTLLHYACFAGFLLVPVVMDVREVMRWRTIRSRM